MNRALALGSILLAALVAAFLWAPKVEDPSAPPEASPPAPIPVLHVLRSEPLNLDEQEEAERVLAELRVRWETDRVERERMRALGGSCGYKNPGYFICSSRHSEFRLLVLGYPALLEAWAYHVLEEADVASDSLSWALTAFETLAEAARAGAREALVRATRHPVPWVGRSALGRLRKVDVDGVHRELYREFARAEVPWAIEALGFFGDGGDDALLGDLAGRYATGPRPYPQSEVVGVANLALTQSRALRSGDWEELARRAILEESGYRSGQHFLWALKVARARRAPWLEATLRERMAKGFLQRGESPYFVEDDAYDFALLTLAEIGGALDTGERDYLRHYGYGCEPRARLTEVLREKGY